MYCSKSGAFKLYLSFNFSRTSGDTALSSSNGPPGAECTITKVIVITASRTGIAVNNLCKIRLNKINFYFLNKQIGKAYYRECCFPTLEHLREAYIF